MLVRRARWRPRPPHKKRKDVHLMGCERHDVDTEPRGGKVALTFNIQSASLYSSSTIASVRVPRRLAGILGELGRTTPRKSIMHKFMTIACLNWTVPFSFAHVARQLVSANNILRYSKDWASNFATFHPHRRGSLGSCGEYMFYAPVAAIIFRGS